MKIAFITYEYPPDTGKGGIGTYTRQMAMLLLSAGIEVHVFGGSHTREQIEVDEGIYLHRVFCVSPHDFRNKVMPVFRKEHEKSPFDLIESAEIHANALEIKKAYPLIKLIVRLHAPDCLVESLKKRYVPLQSKLRYTLGAIKRGYWDAGYWRKYKPEADLDYQFTVMADIVTAPSSSMKNWVVKNWKIKQDKIHVISNPFQPADALLKLPINESFDHKTVIFFGRLNVLKGLVNATKVMKNVLARHPDWKFKVIGDDGAGPDPAGISMRTWIKDQLHQFSDRVFFYDGVSYDQLPSMLKDGEIVILPSLFESFSYTCTEAMAAGKAVVGSNRGGMNDLIEDGKTGLLIDPENMNQLFDAVCFLIENQTACIKMAKRARTEIKSYNRNEHVIEESLKVYHSLVNE